MTPEHQVTYETTMAAVGSKATYCGATGSVVAWMLSSEFGMLAGVTIGLVGLLINWYYRAKADAREQLEHERRMKSL